jgi:predicted adenylyl cyclase CyaB
MIEVELRARFSKEEYDRLKIFLDEHAECLGPDDKRCIYYIFQDRLLKIVHNISKQDAKVSLKMNRLGEGSAFKEIEVHFQEKDIQSMKNLFDHLDLNAKIAEESQQRINYAYKGCEIALKYGKTWGYHLEIEKMIPDSSLQEQAEKEIRSVADELGIVLMTEKEIADFLKEFEERL